MLKRLTGATLALALMSICCPSHSSAAAAPLCTSVLTWGPDQLRYCRNRALGTVFTNVTRAVIVVHGDSRTAQNYYNYVFEDAIQEGVEGTTTIIAPQFITREEVTANGLGTAYEYWSDDGWKDGARAANGSRDSSYAWLDYIVRHLVQNNPNLEHIVVIGFSAGGWLINRYSGTTPVVEEAEASSVTMSFGVGSPSSYMWTSTQRPNSDISCIVYNQYRYGYEVRGTVPYVANLSDQQISDNLFWRSIYYFVGDKDTKGDALDLSCQANTQGYNRRQRAVNYHAQLLNQFKFDYRFFILPNVAHEAAAAFDNPNVRNIMFRWGLY